MTGRRVAISSVLAGLAALAAFAAEAPPKFGAAPEGLVVELKSARSVFGPGEPIAVSASLVNRSKAAIRAVLPDYGSEAGMREPSLSWLAARVGDDGRETPLEPRVSGRCGTGMSAEWVGSIVTIEAGARRAMEKVEPPTNTFDFQAAGTVRLRLRYLYGAGFHGRALRKLSGTPESTGAMGEQAPFELLSEPLDVRIERPLDVVVEAPGPIASGALVPLAPSIRVKAVSRDATAHALRSAEWWLSFEFSDCGEMSVEMPAACEPSGLQRDVELPAGGSVAIAPGGKQTLRASRGGTCKVRAVLTSLAPHGGPRIASAWVPVTFKD